MEEGGQIVQGVPAGAAKEDYELSMFVVAKLASFWPCFLMYHPLLLQGLVATTQPGIPCSSGTLAGLGQDYHHS